jgi:uncharacterized protein (UPF0335 family)
MSLLPNSLEGKAAPLLKRIENLHDEIATERGIYMQKCRELREDVKSIVEEGKDQGIAPKALKGLVKFRALERRQQAIGDGLDIADQSDFETLCAALGDFADTELGQAAVESAKPKGRRTASVRASTVAESATTVDPDAVAARTAEELAESIPEVDQTYSERLAEHNAIGDDMARGEAPPAFN